MCWVLPGAVLLGGVSVTDDEEGSDAYVMQLSLGGWDPAAGGELPGAQLSSFVPAMVEETCADVLSGPYLHHAAVPQWGAVIAAHRKANDEHVMLVQAVPEPQQVMVTHDQLRIALPSGPGGEDNYVLGLAVDFSVDTVSWHGRCCM